MNAEFNRYGFRVDKDIARDEIVVPQQVRNFAHYVSFEEACKPPLWLTTFLTWHPHSIEGLWRTSRGSEWVPVEPVQTMRVGIVEVLQEYRVSMRVLLSGKLRDISEVLHHAGVLRISIPTVETQIRGNVKLIYGDLQHIEDSLNDITECV